jgi:hypothetical protein
MQAYDYYIRDLQVSQRKPTTTIAAANIVPHDNAR